MTFIPKKHFLGGGDKTGRFDDFFSCESQDHGLALGSESKTTHNS